jgi:hypothetical protein
LQQAFYSVGSARRSSLKRPAVGGVEAFSKSTFPQSCDSVEQSTAVANQADPEVLEILCGQARQYARADPALAEHILS